MRKPVYELTLADLEAQPVWEFALDEEGVPGQDEATVRPYATNGQPVPDGGMFVVRAAFRLAGSARHAGYLYYTPELPPGSGFDYGPLASRQPVIVTPEGQVMFWYGRLRPTPEILRAAYTNLGSSGPAVFPVRYVSDIPLETGPVEGEIQGFLYLTDKRQGWFSRTTTVEIAT